MRPLRPGAVRSQRRLAYRRRYATYITSTRWLQRRRQWLLTFRALHSVDPVCVVCDAPWSLDEGDLHHATYTSLGDEQAEDLIAMCRICHEALHRILESSRAWRSMPLPAATQGIISALRTRRTAPS